MQGSSGSTDLFHENIQSCHSDVFAARRMASSSVWRRQWHKQNGKSYGMCLAAKLICTYSHEM
jgi:hypothetical protein